MKMTVFAGRCRRELLRDPLSLIFGVGLPVVLLLLISFIQKSIPEGATNIFEIRVFAPGIAMFSFTFISLFAALLVSKDRFSSFLTRLFASPMTAADYICGYSLPLLPIALAQAVICFGVSLFLGLDFGIGILWSVLALVPTALLFVGFGLLIGTIFTDKQTGPFSSILIQVAALSSGMWFPIDEIGGALATVCYALPFAHSVRMAKEALACSTEHLLIDLVVVLAYTATVFVFAVLAFRERMKQ